MDFGHAAGVADLVVVVAFAAHAVDAEGEGAAFNFIVIGEDEATVAGGTEVFGYVEADSGGDAEVAGVDAVLAGVDYLGGVFEDDEIVFFGDLVDGGHVGELAEEVDGEDRFGFGGDGGFDEGGVDVEGGGVDVDHDRDGAEMGDDLDGGDEREGGGDDFVAGLEAGGLHHDAEGVGSAVDGDGVFDPVAFGNAFFELLAVFAEDVGAGFEDFHAPCPNVFFDFVVLGFEVDKVDTHKWSLSRCGGGWRDGFFGVGRFCFEAVLTQEFSRSFEMTWGGMGLVIWIDACGDVGGAGQALTFERPNILLFLVDDLGWQDTSVAFGEEESDFNRVYRTPHLESLVPESVMYTDAYAACPVCTPSRTAIMTGKSPVRTHITYWTLNGDMSANDEATTAPAWQWQGLEKDDAPFLPQLLADSGYRTIHVGKAHFGAIDTFAADPTEIGFQVKIAGHAAGGPGSFYGTQKFMASLRQGNEEKPAVWDVPGLEKYHGEDIYLTEALTLEARAALREAKANGKPFFMNFAPYAVHAPIMANNRYLGNYPESMDARERAYATMVETYDAALGDLIAE